MWKVLRNISSTRVMYHPLLISFILFKCQTSLPPKDWNHASPLPYFTFLPCRPPRPALDVSPPLNDHQWTCMPTVQGHPLSFKPSSSFFSAVWTFLSVHFLCFLYPDFFSPSLPERFAFLFCIFLRLFFSFFFLLRSQIHQRSISQSKSQKNIPIFPAFTRQKHTHTHAHIHTWAYTRLRKNRIHTH